jgi:lysophospholipase L1-like esterase
MVLGLFLIGAASVICQVRIMPLGDSITKGAHGSSDSTGYRRALYQLLLGAGYSVDFVGSQRDGTPKDFDRDHEGHGGYTANQVRDTVTAWLTANPADIILLHIGTNDITGGQNPSGVSAEVGQILDRIDAVSSSIVVFLARIINRNDSHSAATTQYNLLLQSLAESRVANGDLIYVVNQEAALNYPADLADAVHPNDSGYVKMARCWFTALSTYLSSLPIQLSSFTGRIINQSVVRLEWTTLTETNNFGFEVQRSTNACTGYQTLSSGFVAGHGTSLVPHRYWYADTAAVPGTCYYRLKQIDLDGAVGYSDGIGLNIMSGAKDSLPQGSVLMQSYPNPFNSSVTISFDLSRPSEVRLSVYDILGRAVAVLVNERKNAGSHEVKFDAARLSSGMYLYRLQAGDFAQTKRCLLLK